VVLRDSLRQFTLHAAHSVENYPGFVKATGEELMKAFREHAEHFGAELVQATVTDIRKEGDYFIVTTDQGETRAPTIIYATGSTHRKLNVPGEVELLGKGVSYCARYTSFTVATSSVQSPSGLSA